MESWLFSYSAKLPKHVETRSAEVHLASIFTVIDRITQKEDLCAANQK